MMFFSQEVSCSPCVASLQVGRFSLRLFSNPLFPWIPYLMRSTHLCPWVSSWFERNSVLAGAPDHISWETSNDWFSFPRRREYWTVSRVPPEGFSPLGLQRCVHTFCHSRLVWMFLWSLVKFNIGEEASQPYLLLSLPDVLPFVPWMTLELSSVEEQPPYRMWSLAIWAVSNSLHGSQSLFPLRIWVFLRTDLCIDSFFSSSAPFFGHWLPLGPVPAVCLLSLCLYFPLCLSLRHFLLHSVLSLLSTSQPQFSAVLILILHLSGAISGSPEHGSITSPVSTTKNPRSHYLTPSSLVVIEMVKEWSS